VIDKQEFDKLIDIDRPEWDPTEVWPGRRDGERPVSWIRKWEVHHEAGAGPASMSFLDKQRWALSVERFHEEDKNWYDGFYNVIVFADGSAWAFRNITIPSQRSKPSLIEVGTILLPGDLTSAPATLQQKEKVLRFVNLIGGADADSVSGHRERPKYGSTTCPGDGGIGLVNWVKQNVGTHFSTPTGATQMLYSYVPPGSPFGLPVSWLDGWGRTSAVGASTAINWAKDGFPNQRLTEGEVKGLRERATKWGTLDESTATDDWRQVAALAGFSAVDSTKIGGLDLDSLAEVIGDEVASRVRAAVAAELDEDEAHLEAIDPVLLAQAVAAELAKRLQA